MTYVSGGPPKCQRWSRDMLAFREATVWLTKRILTTHPQPQLVKVGSPPPLERGVGGGEGVDIHRGCRAHVHSSGSSPMPEKPELEDQSQGWHLITQHISTAIQRLFFTPPISPHLWWLMIYHLFMSFCVHKHYILYGSRLIHIYQQWWW